MDINVTMNKKHYIGMGIVIVLLLAFMVPRYFSENVTASGMKISGDIEKIEVIHFHASRQCYSCVTVGELAKETLDTYFSKELNSGEIIFEHVNIDLSENSEKVNKYGATGSSLIIGTYYRDGTFSKEQNTNVWYKIDNEESFLSYFKGVMKSKLLGE